MIDCLNKYTINLINYPRSIEARSLKKILAENDELRDEKPVICLSVSVPLGASNFCCYVGNI